MDKLGTMLGFVCHAMFTVLGVITIQGGVWWFGIGMIGYVVVNIVNEVTITKQNEVIELLTERLSQDARNN